MKTSCIPAIPDTQRPNKLTLLGNYPNPFNPGTRIDFFLTRSTNVKVTVYNYLGQEIASLFDGRMDSGMRHVEWNGTDSAGRDAVSGIYIYRIQTEKEMLSQKMMLIR